MNTRKTFKMKLPIIKYKNKAVLYNKLKKVKGGLPTFILRVTKKLKTKGCIIIVMNKTLDIPITLIVAIECIAGCWAKNSAPVPIMVVTPDSIIADLYDFE